jgi:hypothetical protein
VPNHIDVLVVGDADEDAVFDSARAAERMLGREVNMHRVSLRAWQRGDADPFLTSVRSPPLVSVDLDS